MIAARRAAFFLFALLWFAPSASALDLFWVGGTANWDGTAGSKWSLTSGGVGGVAIPGAGDDVHFDGNSGAVTVTYTVSSTFGSLDFTGFTGTFTQNSGIIPSLDGGGTNDVLKFSAAMTYAPGANRTIQIINTSGTIALTSAGKTISALTQNGAGGTVQLQDALIVRSDGTFTLTAGSFDANNQNVTTGAFNGSNTNTRSLTMGSGTWTINGTSGFVWTIQTNTGLTFSGASSSLVISSALAAARSVSLGTGKTYGNITIANTANNAFDTAIDALTSVASTSLSLTAPLILRLNVPVTWTVTNPVNWNGTAFDSTILIIPSASAAPTFALAGGSTMNWVAIGGLTFTGSPVATNSFNLKGNSGITITGPSGGGGRCIGC